MQVQEAGVGNVHGRRFYGSAGSGDGVFSRDLIDLAMMRPSLQVLRAAVAKAQQPYGAAVLRDLARAIDRMRERTGWLERCLGAMAMRDPPALVWQRIRALRRVLPPE